jgi:hypothetical protein
MVWVGELFKRLSIGGWQMWEDVPPPQLLLILRTATRTIQGEEELLTRVHSFTSFTDVQ